MTDNLTDNLLVLILLCLMKNKSLKSKARWLSFSGLSNVEIANFLEMYEHDVVKYLLTKPTKRKKAKK